VGDAVGMFEAQGAAADTELLTVEGETSERKMNSADKLLKKRKSLKRSKKASDKKHLFTDPKKESKGDQDGKEGKEDDVASETTGADTGGRRNAVFDSFELSCLN